MAVQGHLYLFDAALQKFAPTEQNTHVVVSRYDTGYWLTVEGMGGFWVSQAIEEEMAMNFSLVCPPVPLWRVMLKRHSASAR